MLLFNGQSLHPTNPQGDPRSYVSSKDSCRHPLQNASFEMTHRSKAVEQTREDMCPEYDLANEYYT
jgi:hypothetical protein